MNAMSPAMPSLPVAPHGAVRAAAEDRFILAYGDTLRTWAAEASRLNAVLLPSSDRLCRVTVLSTDSKEPQVFAAIWFGDESDESEFHVEPTADGRTWALIRCIGWATVGTFKSLEAALQAICRTAVPVVA